MPMTFFFCLHSKSGTVLAPYSFASVANFVRVIVCWKGSYQKLDFSKQDLFYLILQFLKMVNL